MPLNTIMKISTYNEYGNLKSIIVGSAKNMSWPANDPEFDKSIERSTYPGSLNRGQLPDKIIMETEEDLDSLVQILENRDIEVFRPSVDQPHWAYSARDIILCVGELVIQCPTPFSSRANELKLYPFLHNCKIIEAPRPLVTTDPIFDAANVLKVNDKLIYSLSHSANDAGADWLQQQVGNKFEVIKWQVVEHSITHIDSTLLTLNENTVIVNASRVKDADLPLFMKNYNKIWIDDVVAREYDNFPYASKWIGMNVLSLDPETVLVDEIQVGLIDRLREKGFDVITTPLRHSRTLGGGFHCVTNDLERA